MTYTKQILLWVGILIVLVTGFDSCHKAEASAYTNPRPQLIEQWKWDLIVQQVPDQPYVIAMIGYCETRLTNAVGAEFEEGWLQIHPVHGIAVELLRDPVVSLAIAGEMARERPNLADWIRTRSGCPEWWAA